MPLITYSFVVRRLGWDSAWGDDVSVVSTDSYTILGSFNVRHYYYSRLKKLMGRGSFRLSLTLSPGFLCSGKLPLRSATLLLFYSVFSLLEEGRWHSWEGLRKPMWPWRHPAKYRSE